MRSSGGDLDNKKLARSRNNSREFAVFRIRKRYRTMEQICNALPTDPTMIGLPDAPVYRALRTGGEQRSGH